LKNYIFLFSFIALCSLAQLPPESGDGHLQDGVTYNQFKRSHRLFIQNVTLIDGSGDRPQLNMSVLVQNGRIQKIKKAGFFPTPAHAEVVDGTGMFLMPGMIDTHTHFWESGSIYTSPFLYDLRNIVPFETHIDWVRSRAEFTLSRFLCGGVTTIVEMSNPWEVFDIRERNRNNPFTPRMFVAGRIIGNVLPGGLNFWTDDDPAALAAATPAEAKRQVREQIAKGANLIKAGWLQLPGGPTVDTFIPIFRVMAREAHRAGIPIAVHATELESARAFANAGADILAHIVSDMPVDQEFIDLLLEKKVSVSTTMYFFNALANAFSEEPELLDIEHQCGDPQIIDSWSDLAVIPEDHRPPEPFLVPLAPLITDLVVYNASVMAEAGVQLVAGTDAGNIGLLAGPSIHREFQLMEEAGMSPMDIIVSATRDAARAIWQGNKLGMIKRHYLADMLLLAADPTMDISNLSTINYVIKGGTLIPFGDLHAIEDNTPPLVPTF
jgi:imidazolonepropionase-like amidohydrolase